MGPGRKAVGAGGEIPYFPWLRDSPEEVERFIPTSALWLREASKAPSRGKNRAWPGKNSWEGSRAQNSPCCASREQGCAWGREQGKETRVTGSSSGLPWETERQSSASGSQDNLRKMFILPAQPAFRGCCPPGGAEGLGCLGVNCSIT